MCGQIRNGGRAILDCSQCALSEVIRTDMGDLRYCTSPRALKEKVEFIKLWGEIPDSNYAIACTCKQIRLLESKG